MEPHNQDNSITVWDVPRSNIKTVMLPPRFPFRFIPARGQTHTKYLLVSETSSRTDKWCGVNPVIGRHFGLNWPPFCSRPQRPLQLPEMSIHQFAPFTTVSRLKIYKTDVYLNIKMVHIALCTIWRVNIYSTAGKYNKS